MKKLVLCCLVAFLLPVCGLFALTDEVASITFIDKQSDPKKPKELPVSILRNATQISDKDIDFGTTLQNFDTIRTGANSTVEITIYPKTGISSVLTIKPSTILTLDISALKSSQKGSVNLLSGALALKVQKMSGDSQLSVRTATANMGVRGTQFEVTYSTTGDILLLTSEGRVECTVDDGKVLFSAPGDIVQGTFEGEWSSVPVAVNKLEEFKKKWHAQRIDAFRANPAKATRQFAFMYYRSKDKFNAAYAELMANRDLILKWIKEDNNGNIGALADRNRDKLKLIVGLAKLRKVMVHFERVYYRLLQLDELYAQGIAPTGLVRPGVTVAKFYKDFRNEREDFAMKFADIQFITKLYAKRNDGSFPLDETPDTDTFGAGKIDDGSDSFFEKDK